MQSFINYWQIAIHESAHCSVVSAIASTIGITKYTNHLMIFSFKLTRGPRAMCSQTQ